MPRRRCIHHECTKSAIGKTDYCIEHGGGKRCKEERCTKSARGKTDYCKRHGGGKRCKEERCTKSAVGKTDYCVEHGGGERCKKEGCTKSAVGKTDYCVEHGGGERCKKEGCTKSAIGKTDYCVEHGGGKRCPHCKDWTDSRSGCKKYDGYCATCFKHVFPTDPRSKILYQKSHENKVRNYLNENKAGFIHDTPIYSGNCDCSHRRRIDFRMMIGGTILAVEVDENQHSSYDKKDEDIRYDDLYMIHSGKWIFIRFNPDGYKDHRNNYKNQNIKSRLPVLLNEINHQIKRIENDENTELVEIHKLYFDGFKIPV